MRLTTKTTRPELAKFNKQRVHFTGEIMGMKAIPRRRISLLITNVKVSGIDKPIDHVNMVFPEAYINKRVREKTIRPHGTIIDGSALVTSYERRPFGIVRDHDIKDVNLGLTNVYTLEYGLSEPRNVRFSRKEH